MEEEYSENAEEISDDTLMYYLIFKGGIKVKVELPIEEVPSSKEELNLARNISPIVYWTGAIIDWNEISGCIPDYSNV